MEQLLTIKNLSVQYGGVRALDSANLYLDEGEAVALIGPNGAGKSTVLKAIFGLAPIVGGQIMWHEKMIKPVSYQMAQLGIAFVPQGRRVFASLTVQENLEIGAFGLKNKIELKRRLEEILDLFPVLKKKNKFLAGHLSGGEQQLLAIARALMIDPKILLLDEPSLGLAPKMVKEVFVKIQEINERHRTTIMIVEHNIKSVLEIVGRVYVLDKGQVAGEGAPRDIVDNKIFERVFMN